MESIKGLVKSDTWKQYIESNKDGYGGACVKIARRVMQYLDEHPDIQYNIGYSPDMTTTHGIICHCDADEGITGFQAGAVRNMVAGCYRDGWKFWIADLINPHNCNDEIEIARIASEIIMEFGIDENIVMDFVEGLIQRMGRCPEEP